MACGISTERFLYIHKEVWNSILYYYKYNKHRTYDNYALKCEILDSMNDKGEITNDERAILSDWANCCLCAAVQSNCDFCVLHDCISDKSLYVRANKGDLGAIIEIRDCLDFLKGSRKKDINVGKRGRC